jgi:hydrogenase nickel incorporation protein HypB
MCVTCGCSDGGETTYTHFPDASQNPDDQPAVAPHEPHSHHLPDGRVITHSHAHQGHSQAHPGSDPAPTADHHHHHGMDYHHNYEHYQGHDHGQPISPAQDHEAKGESGQDFSHLSTGMSSVAAAASTHTTTLEINLLAKNNLLAAQNRGWFEGRNVLALNLMSSPGAGKTTLLTRTINDLKDRLTFAVIEGDQATVNDAQRIRETGCNVVQVNTGTGCHLEADMVQRGIQTLNPPGNSVLMIENVGNLVCPALFDLGERAKVAILSVTEGDDKPIKYPHLFRACQIMLLNKIDLLPYVSFDVDRCLQYARQVNPDIQVLPVSATSGEGLDHWYGWILEQLAGVEMSA